jgi:hypothetical protein
MTRRIVATSSDDPPANGEVLVYDSAQDSWDSVASSTLTGAAHTMASHSDNTIGGIAFTGSGTSFPGSPATNDHFYRTNIRGGMMFFWDGTYWLSEQQFSCPFYADDKSGYFAADQFPLPRDLDVYLVAWSVTCYVATTNDATRYWHGDMQCTLVDNSATASLGSWSSQSKTASQWNICSGALTPALLDTTGEAAGNRIGVWVAGTYTGVTPGHLWMRTDVAYRLRAT